MNNDDNVLLQLLKIFLLINIDIGTIIIFNLIFLAVILAYGMLWTNILLIFYIFMIFLHIYVRLNYNHKF